MDLTARGPIVLSPPRGISCPPGATPGPAETLSSRAQRGISGPEIPRSPRLPRDDSRSGGCPDRYEPRILRPGTVDPHRILILDYGSQFTQLIARRIREERVYCEIHPPTRSLEWIREWAPKGIILSGGPSSVYGEDVPTARAGAAAPGRPGARRLLRDAAHHPPGGRRGGARAARVRPRADHRARAGGDLRGLRARGADAGLDEPRRPRGGAAARVPAAGEHRRLPLGGLPRRGPRGLRRAVPPGGGAHASAARR